MYTKANHDVTDVLSDLIGQHYPELADAEVSVDVLFKADNLNQHGYPVIAMVKVTPLKQRALGQDDALIVIDSIKWSGLTDEEKAATLDHELYHLEVQYDNEGKIKSDDLGRPKLKLRPHDWQLGGFQAIAQRHGRNAIESQALSKAVADYRQLIFAWSDDMVAQHIDGMAEAIGEGSTITFESGGESVTLKGRKKSKGKAKVLYNAENV